MTAGRVLELLRSQGRTLAVAESLTGGLLADAFVRVPGASAVLLGGVVAYATPVKHTVLGVDADLLDREGPVDPEVARQMADGSRPAPSGSAWRWGTGSSRAGRCCPATARRCGRRRSSSPSRRCWTSSGPRNSARFDPVTSGTATSST
jgi:nicotinamide-nucleotide amidase